MRFPTSILIAAVLLAFTPGNRAAENVTGDVAFEAKVLPLLKARCGECHAGAENKSGLSVLTVPDLLTGGAARGAAIVPSGRKRTPQDDLGAAQAADAVQRRTARG